MHATSQKYDALAKELQDARDHATNQQHDLEKKLRASQEQTRSLQEVVDEAQAESSTLERQHKHQLQEIELKHATLQKTLSDMRVDLDNKATMLQTAQDRLSMRDAEVGHLESEVLRLKAETGDLETLAVVKRELSEQVSHIRTLERTNREQNKELKHFRQVHKAVEIVEEEKRVLENRVRLMDDLRHELGEAQIQRRILEDERQSWTSYLQAAGTGDVDFDSPENLARAFMQGRLEKASLLERLGAVQPEVSEKEEIIRGLEAERSKLHIEIEKLKASGGNAESRSKSRLERQKVLAVKEVEYLREQLRTFDNEETIENPEKKFDGQSSKRTEDLEALVDQYREELQALNDELSKREDILPPREPQGLKRPREEEPDGRLGSLSRKNRKLQDELSTIQQSTVLLQKELEATKSQLSSLQSSSRTRVLELRSNPTADAEALKLNTITTLRAENKALLAQLEGQPHNTKVVPITTLENVRLEIMELERLVAEKEKRMLRLRQIWSLKSLEFREAVVSLLGWKMDFMPNGRFRMTSIFNLGMQGEDDESGGNSLIFDGESGTMKISGGPASDFAAEIRPLVKYWVEERKEIVGLMAAITLEFYDKTTRAARM